MNYYTGTIIEESLSQKLNLDQFRATPLNTTTEEVTDEHATPWLKQWTLTTFKVPEENAQKLAETLASTLETEHASWYVDFKDSTKHYIVFPNKIFHIDRNPQSYRKVMEYGLSLGIPAHQLDFSPNII